MEQKLLSLFDTVADGIAADGIAVIDDFLSASEVSDIINDDDFSHAMLRFKKAGVGKQQEKQVNEGIRGDYIQWIDPATASAPVQVYMQRISQLRTFLNQSLFLSLKDEEIHRTVYPVGTFYKRHLDQFKKDDHRKITVICYLNPNWKEEEGGQLRVYFTDGAKDFYPVAGRLVCFRSDLLEHEVLPATRERLSVTGWMLDTLMA